MLGIVFLQFIGFKYSAYIAGEVRGNVSVACTTACSARSLIGVLANSLYVDLFSNHIGFNATATEWLHVLGRRHERSPCRSASPVDAAPAVIANKRCGRCGR